LFDLRNQAQKEWKEHWHHLSTRQAGDEKKVIGLDGMFEIKGEDFVQDVHDGSASTLCTGSFTDGIFGKSKEKRWAY